MNDTQGKICGGETVKLPPSRAEMLEGAPLYLRTVRNELQALCSDIYGEEYSYDPASMATSGLSLAEALNSLDGRLVEEKHECIDLISKIRAAIL